MTREEAIFDARARVERLERVEKQLKADLSGEYKEHWLEIQRRLREVAEDLKRARAALAAL